MADEYKVKVKFVPDTSSLKNALGNLGTVGVGGMASGATGGGLGNIGKGMGSSLKGMTGMLGGILKAVLPMAALLMVVGNGLKPLITGIGILLRPIRDILMIGLMPLLYIMRPIGIFFRTLMKPYYQKAMALMRTGAMLQKSGDFGGAMEAYAMGGVQLMTGMIAATTTGLVAAFNILMGVTDPVAKAIQTVSGYTMEWVNAIDLASVGIINSAHAAGAINTEQWDKLVSVFVSAGSPKVLDAITGYADEIGILGSWFEDNSDEFGTNVSSVVDSLSKLGLGMVEIARTLLLALTGSEVDKKTTEKFGEKPSYSVWDTLEMGVAGATTGFLSTGMPQGAVVGALAMMAGDVYLQLKEIEKYEEETLEYKKSIWDETALEMMAKIGSESPALADIMAGIDTTDLAFGTSFGEGGTIPTSINQSKTELDSFNTSWGQSHNLEDVNLNINIHTNYTSSGRRSRR